jgi:hypothetical protein
VCLKNTHKSGWASEVFLSTFVDVAATQSISMSSDVVLQFVPSHEQQQGEEQQQDGLLHKLGEKLGEKQQNCSICIKPFTSTLRKEIKCHACDLTACMECVKMFLLTSSNDPKCMQCNLPWNREILVSSINKHFCNSEYKRHRKEILFQRERALFPETMPYVQLYQHKKSLMKNEMTLRNERDKYVLDVQRLDNQIDHMYLMVNSLESIKKLHEFMNERVGVKNKISHIDHKINDLETIIHLAHSMLRNNRLDVLQTFNRQCPVETCQGFLSIDYICGLCQTHICHHCNKVLQHGHNHGNANVTTSVTSQATDRATEASQFTEATEATEATQFIEATEAIQFIEATEATDQATEATEATQFIEATEAIQFIEATEATDQATEATQFTEATEAIQEATQSTEATDQATEATQFTEATEAEAIQEATQSTEATGDTGSTGDTGATHEATTTQAITTTDSAHKCNPDDVATVKLLSMDTKPCPKCATPIFKIDGCDLMFCTQCFAAFSWRSGEVHEGRIHNPHYYQYLRDRGTLPREADDIPCGGLPTFSQLLIKGRGMARTCPRQHHNVLVAMTRLFGNVTQQQDPNQGNVHELEENRRMRIRFLVEEIDEAKFKKYLYDRDLDRERRVEIYQIKSMMRIVLIDLIQRIMADESIDIIGEEMKGLINFANDALAQVEKYFGRKTLRYCYESGGFLVY